jgi:ferritin-like metal-binding protein YciE
MENILKELLAQRVKLQDELIAISKREYGDEKSVLKAIELNNELIDKLIDKLINKPVETTNEQPKSETIFEIKCDKPGGCKCDTFAYIVSCKYSHEPNGNRNLWMIDSEDREG